jgi:hypothetical protein
MKRLFWVPYDSRPSRSPGPIPALPNKRQVIRIRSVIAFFSGDLPFAPLGFQLAVCAELLATACVHVTCLTSPTKNTHTSAPNKQTAAVIMIAT